MLLKPLFLTCLVFALSNSCKSRETGSALSDHKTDSGVQISEKIVDDLTEIHKKFKEDSLFFMQTQRRALQRITDPSQLSVTFRDQYREDALELLIGSLNNIEAVFLNRMIDNNSNLINLPKQTVEINGKPMTGLKSFLEQNGRYVSTTRDQIERSKSFVDKSAFESSNATFDTLSKSHEQFISNSIAQWRSLTSTDGGGSIEACGKLLPNQVCFSSQDGVWSIWTIAEKVSAYEAFKNPTTPQDICEKRYQGSKAVDEQALKSTLKSSEIRSLIEKLDIPLVWAVTGSYRNELNGFACASGFPRGASPSPSEASRCNRDNGPVCFGSYTSKTYGKFFNLDTGAVNEIKLIEFYGREFEDCSSGGSYGSRDENESPVSILCKKEIGSK